MIDYVIFKNAFSSLFFLLAIFSMFMVSSSVDTMTASQSLTGSMTIVSNQGEFEMGFNSPENSGKFFLAIWYKSISAGTVVWIANRDAPLNDTSAVLRVTQQGNLTLSLNSSNSIVWSSNHSANVENPIAQLLDTGNLVVRDANDADPNNYLWQSFDYPTDTLLPGVKFGKNFVTGIDRVLYSWKSNTDPSRGNYLFEFDTHGYPQHFLMSNGTTPKFRSGPWNGIRFSGSPGLRPNPIYTFYYVFNQEEVYYSFELVNEAVKSRLVLQQDGVLRRLTWNNGTMGWTTFVSAPADNCDNYGQCYGNGICNMANSPVCGCLDKFVPRSKENWDNADWSGGCVRRIPLNCSKGDGFIRYENIKLPDTKNSWYNVTMTLRECREICTRNCSCTAFSNLNITNGGSGCLLWFDELMDIRQLPENGQDIYIRLASSEVAGSKWTTRKKITVSLAVLAGAVLLGLVLGLFCALRVRNNRRKQQELDMIQLEGVPQSTEQSQSNRSQKEDLELPLFDLEKISIATDNFSHQNKIGEGGFGPVYKGVLEDGQEIAVKRLSKHSAQGPDEFKNEVIFIAKLQHRNLVRLLGCCIQGEEKLLIYEYMPNNSLDTFIFDEMRCTLLDWPQRFNIIHGTARGLLYLHQDSRLRIIHRDLKAANVLLDSDLNPKISDFGMARSFGGNDSEASTKRVVGTYGYMPPEYAVDGIFSVKSDVFSFGVLVLEIVSGQKNRGFYHPNHHHNLLGHAWLLYQEGRSVELIDDHLAKSCHLAEVLRSIHVSLLCVQQNPEDRPSMSSVILMLASEGPLASPKEPGFFTERNVYFDPASSSGKQTASSGKKDTSNEISITLLDAR